MVCGAYNGPALINNKARLVYWQGGLFLRVRHEAPCAAVSGVLRRGSIGYYKGIKSIVEASTGLKMKVLVLKRIA